jgi:plasmid stabilization system protein ParE
MKYEVVIPVHVRTELESASEWHRVRSQSDEVANRWLRGFQDAMASLERNPERCPIDHESEPFPFELRELLYGSGRRKTHRALFRISGEQVEVVAIRHVAQRDLRPDDM